MRYIREDLRTFLSSSKISQKASVSEVRRDPGYIIGTYFELVEKVATLSNRNPDHLLFFRGQQRDHLNSKGASDFYPEIFRADNSKRVLKSKLHDRFVTLRAAEQALIKALKTEKFLGSQRLRRYEVFRWAILQHYDICATPLLDFTQSLRVACSFASGKSVSKTKYGFIFVFGFPHLSGGVTTSAEKGVQIIRLLSTCPPKARRPHHQEGYLAGDYPSMTPELISEIDRMELNFARRLICKFRISLDRSFWSRGYPKIPQSALFPNRIDEFEKIADLVRSRL